MNDPIEDVEGLIGARPDTWGFVSWETADSNLYLVFRHKPSEDRPDGQPLTFEQLRKLDDEYGIVEVRSASDGETGSVLIVETETL